MNLIADHSLPGLLRSRPAALRNPDDSVTIDIESYCSPSPDNDVSSSPDNDILPSLDNDILPSLDNDILPSLDGGGKTRGRPPRCYPFLKGYLRRIAELIGISRLIKLVRWNNKRHRRDYLYIPLCAKKTHPIAQVIGHQALKKLSAEFGGVIIRMPSDGHMVAAKHTAAALVAAYPHKSMGEIALLARVDKSVVYQAVHSALHRHYQPNMSVSQS